MRRSNKPRTEFGKKLCSLRIERDETIADMTEKLGVHRTYVSMLEHGSACPSESLIKKIANVYQLSEEEKEKFYDSARKSKRLVKIYLIGKPVKTIDLIITFAEKVDDLSEEDMTRILEILNERRDNETD